MIYSIEMYSGMLPCEAQIPDTLFICSFITAEEPLTYYRVFVLFATPRFPFFPPCSWGKTRQILRQIHGLTYSGNLGLAYITVQMGQICCRNFLQIL